MLHTGTSGLISRFNTMPGSLLLPGKYLIYVIKIYNAKDLRRNYATAESYVSELHCTRVNTGQRVGIMLKFFDKVRFCSFLMIGILVCLAWYAGCLDESDTITRTPEPVTPVIHAKFVKGDIIAKTASSAAPYFIILNYDSMTGRYERAFVYQKTDGSWYRYNNKSEFSDRDLIEKIYPAKVGYVPSVSLIPVQTPVPALLTTNVDPVPSKTGTPSSQSLSIMAPVARFTASPVQGRSPLNVQFTDTSVSAGTTTYQWDVDNDGNPEYTIKNPVHTYQVPGKYTIKLTVTNASGTGTEIKTHYISVSSSQNGECFGAESCNPTGNPIGGGAGYTRIITLTDDDVKYRVSTKDQLLSALTSAQAGDVVFVQGDAVIDLTGTWGHVIPAGVTLASDRGKNGSAGAKIIRHRVSPTAENTWDQVQLFTVGGDNVRITGLRFEGPDSVQDKNSEDETGIRPKIGIKAVGRTGLEVDNCELYYWSDSAINLENYDNPSADAYIHHNYMHHCHARGYGYGVSVYGGYALIEANLFDYTRHAICADGYPDEKYEARYNIHLGHGNAIGGHHFDVHAYPPDDEETVDSIAGYEYKIHHNTFELTELPCIGIRALPKKGVWIDHNIFKTSYDDPPVFQRYAGTFGRMYMTQNYIGKDGSAPVLVPGEDILYLHP